MPFVAHFAGGEDHQFNKFGAAALSTSASNFRSGYSRCGLSTNATTAYWTTKPWFNGAQSSLWMSVRGYIASVIASTSAVIGLLSGTTLRLVLRFSASNTLSLYKRNSVGTETLLAAGSATIASNTLLKYDLSVTYAASGRVIVYVDGNLYIDYSGDVTTDGQTTLDGTHLGGGNNGNAAIWSELIVANEDTRNLSLVNLPPLAAGNAQQWTGAVGDINETTLSDSTLLTTATTGHIAQFTVTSTGLQSTAYVKAVGQSVRAMRGGSGPQNLDLGFRLSGVDYWQAAPQPSTVLDAVSKVWLTDPATGAAWTTAAIKAAAFNIGARAAAEGAAAMDITKWTGWAIEGPPDYAQSFAKWSGWVIEGGIPEGQAVAKHTAWAIVDDVTPPVATAQRPQVVLIGF